jgi:hypothetical protein
MENHHFQWENHHNIGIFRWVFSGGTIRLQISQLGVVEKPHDSVGSHRHSEAKASRVACQKFHHQAIPAMLGHERERTGMLRKNQEV